MQVAIKCILLALQESHALQWAINDIQWENIIFVGDVYGGKWWLIDCEHAQKFESSLPRIRAHAMEPGHVCSASSDLALMGALFVEVQELVRGSQDLTQLQDALQSTRQRRKTSAAKLLELSWLKALIAPPSSSSSGISCCWNLSWKRLILLLFSACNFRLLQSLCDCRIWC